MSPVSIKRVAFLESFLVKFLMKQFHVKLSHAFRYISKQQLKFDMQEEMLQSEILQCTTHVVSFELKPSDCANRQIDTSLLCPSPQSAEGRQFFGGEKANMCGAWVPRNPQDGPPPP